MAALSLAVERKHISVRLSAVAYAPSPISLLDCSLQSGASALPFKHSQYCILYTARQFSSPKKNSFFSHSYGERIVSKV